MYLFYSVKIEKMKHFFLSCKESRIEPTSPKTYYGCFYVGPFETGQGLTVANALRRTLLSEISGLAITEVKIDGIFHEYSTLTGVRETALDILLNLKEIILRKKSNQPLNATQIGYLQARGPGIARASDLILPPQIECVDPDQYVATLSDNGKLSLKLKIDEGKNFVFINNEFDSCTLNKNFSYSNGNFLPIDTVFTPIKRINYTVEPYIAKSIQNSNEVIILEIWTNGSVSPKTALSQTLNHLRTLFNNLGQLKILDSLLTSYSLEKNQNFRQIFKNINYDLNSLPVNFSKEKTFKSKFQNTFSSNFSKKISNKIETPAFLETLKKSNNEWELSHLNELGLPFRIFKCLTKAKIDTVDQLLKLSCKEIKQIPGMSPQSLIILKKTLELKNLFLN